MGTSLASFIEHARTKGMDHATIRMLLLDAGWKEKDIADALTAQALDIPVPLPPDVGGAREAFLYLVTFTALYTFIGYALTLIFSYIELRVPDAATVVYGQLQSESDRSVIPVAMAAVFVSFPIFMLVSALLNREIRKSPDKAGSRMRRLLTYLTLFAAALTLAVDLIVLVTFFLQGELSVRFLLKVAAVIVVGGACFWYYFRALKMTPEEAKTTQLHRVFGWATTVVVVASMALGVSVVGSPGTERLRRFDAQRASDIKMISEVVFDAAVGTDWRNPAAPLAIKQPLPQTLRDVLAASRNRRPRIKDPENGTTYEYAVLGDSRFQVCATFNQARDEAADVAWNHPAGRHCFEFDALNPRR